MYPGLDVGREINTQCLKKGRRGVQAIKAVFMSSLVFIVIVV
jgi:hypothetical protein